MYEPWIEKYRPKSIKDIVLTPANSKLIQNLINKDLYPNLLLYGPPGTGKTTTIMCLMNDYCKHHNCTNNYIHLNASHERGIDVIRNQIFDFSNKSCMFNPNQRKFVLLDEVDSMTKQAQHNLDIVIKNCKNKVTFILICNFLNRVIDNLRQSFLTLRFSQTSTICDNFIDKFLKNEKLDIPSKKIELIKKNHLHDLRSIINNIQNYHSRDTFLDEKTFQNLINNKVNSKYLNKILLHHDISTIFCFFFNMLFENYKLDSHTIYMMKLLLTLNKSSEFFIEEFIPYISKKLKIL
jgi:DNA polymerase III delta prime subunit